MKTLKTTPAIIAAITLTRGHAIAQRKTLAGPVNAVISNYLAVKTALSINDGSTAERKAAALLTSINALTTDGLYADESTLLAKLEYDSRHISEVNRITHQREYFASLSDNLYTLLKKFRVNSTTMYREYCPMTKNHYLTDKKKAADPYMGMATCSKTVEKLEPAK